MSVIKCCLNVSIKIKPNKSVWIITVDLMAVSFVIIRNVNVIMVTLHVNMENWVLYKIQSNKN